MAFSIPIHYPVSAMIYSVWSQHRFDVLARVSRRSAVNLGSRVEFFNFYIDVFVKRTLTVIIFREDAHEYDEKIRWCAEGESAKNLKTTNGTSSLSNVNVNLDVH